MAQKVQEWTDLCYAYLHVSIYGDGDALQMLSPHLIPRIQHLIMQKIATDKMLAQDAMVAILKHTGEFWKDKVAHPIIGDKEAIKDVLYGDYYPVYKQDENKNSLMKLLADKSGLNGQIANFVSTKAFHDKLNEIVLDSGLYSYIKANFGDHITKKVIPALKKAKDASGQPDAKKILAADRLSKVF